MASKKTTRILFIIDGSSSMLEEWTKDMNRFNAGRQLVHDIMDSVYSQNPNVEFGLRVFGHTYTVDKNNCFDTKLEVRFSPFNSEMVNGRLELISPQGVSPIALSLKESAEIDILSSNKYAYSLILITDGHESCGGDICHVMLNLINKKINFTPYIISLNNDKTLLDQYDCMGEFMSVTNRSEFIPVIQKIMTDNNYFIATNETTFTPLISYNPTQIKETEEVKKVEVKFEPEVKINEVPKSTFIKTIVNKRVDTYPKPMVKYKIIIRPYAQEILLAPLPRFNFPKEVIENTVSQPVVKNVEPEELKVTTPTKKEYSVIKKAVVTGFPIKPLTQKSLSIKANTIKINPLPKFIFPKETPPAGSNNTQLANVPNKTPTKYHPIDKEKTDLKDQKTFIKAEDKSDNTEPGTLQIYFTNGKGKYYNSSPKIRIKDNNTGTTVFEGNREIFQSAPESITLPDGQYTISIVESERSAQVTIEKGKNKRVEIVVGSGNIVFAYTGTNEIPHGYIATVSKRFEQGDIVEHPTELKLYYDASNYHIEINTLPILMYNVNVEADNQTLISIPKPGKVQILNEDELGRIEFWHNLAGQSYRFYEMSIYGDIEYQQVELRPGTYEIKYPFIKESGERVMKVKTITLKSLQELKITLN